MKNIVVLLSGNGLNLQSINEHFANSEIAKIKKVFSNSSTAYGLRRAENIGIPTTALCEQFHSNVDDFNKLLFLAISKENPDILVLDHYNRILTPDFIKLLKIPIISIHQSLLPKHKGLHPVKDALISGDNTTGISIHLVNEDADSGAVLYQKEIEILPGDTEDKLISKLEQMEYHSYPTVIKEILTNPCSNLFSLDKV